MPIISRNLNFHCNKTPFSNFSSKSLFPIFKHSLDFPKSLNIKCAKKAKRTGNLRYPSEKRRLRLKEQPKTDAKNRLEDVLRLPKLGVLVHEDPGKDFWGVCGALLTEIAKILKFSVPSMLPVEAFTVVRKSFDARKGGTGTWSDGKLVIRIGRNNNSVLTVTIRFGTRVNDLLVKGERVFGVKLSDSNGSFESSNQNLESDAIVLAVGHSARDTYEMLLYHNVDVIRKDFSVGLWVEHPQELINNIRYSVLAGEVRNGRGKVPVADYQVSQYVTGKDMNTITTSNLNQLIRSCYSFRMCPSGQVVLTSTDPSELCTNGMSFSKRSSRWANAALVVNVSSKDFNDLNFHGPLVGVQFQRSLERKAATMGGGNFVVLVQTVTDFLDNRLSVASISTSSYRLGVKSANLHELFPSHITANRLLSLLQTRTSSPIQITLRSDTWESTSLKGLYPVGEGARYAGGILSAAVDGMLAGFAVAQNLGLYNGNSSIESILGKAQNAGFVKY